MCVISVKLQSNFIEITLRRGCSPVNLLHIFRKHFYKNKHGMFCYLNAKNDSTRISDGINKTFETK